MARLTSSLTCLNLIRLTSLRVYQYDTHRGQWCPLMEACMSGTVKTFVITVLGVLVGMMIREKIAEASTAPKA